MAEDVTTAIRVGIADALSAIPDLQASPWQLANPTPPACHVYPADADYTESTFGRGIDQIPMTVQVLVAEAPGDIAQQKALDAYLSGSGERSVKEHLELDATLGGVCSDLFVASRTGARLYLFEGRPPALGAEWRVVVIAPGS